MKHLTCEMCGSTDLLKQDGVFVCQSCGCKYSVEEAKKMMIEGKVDVSGSQIIIDNSVSLQKYYASARAAIDRKDWRSVLDAYTKIELENPGDMESVYFKTLARTRLTYGDSNMQQRRELFDQLANCIKMFHEKVKNKEIPQEDLKPLIERIHISIIDLSASKFVYTTTVKVVSGAHVSDNMGDTTGLIGYVSGVYMGTIEDIINYLPGDIHANADFVYAKIIEVYETAESAYGGGFSYKPIQKAHINWNKKNPNHTIPSNYAPKESSSYSSSSYSSSSYSSSSSGGCYVATCVYGSYDCPQVWTLRRFRDDTLGSTWYGRAFIHTYYAISPTLVKWFGKTNWFKKMWRGTLDRMVKNLQLKGVEDTPYDDKIW